MRYYTLRYNGNLLKNRDRDLIVGQCNDAGLKLPSDGRWENENSAVIRYRRDSDSWCAVRMSPNSSFRINGVEVKIARALDNGDVIEIDDTSIRFNIFDDLSYNPVDGIVLFSAQIRRRFRALACILATIILTIIGITISNDKSRNADCWNLAEYEPSVRKITADSVFIQKLIGCEYVTVDSVGFAGDFVPSGCCFFTIDGKLVTARHCIEPWLDWDPMRNNDSAMISVLDLVMEVETAKYYKEDSMRLVTRLLVDDMVYYSTAFNYNTDRDLIINYGTRSKRLMWRSIRPSYHKRDNELGDIAWIDDCGINGNLELAGSRQLTSLKKDEFLAILGYPIQDKGMKQIKSTGVLKLLPEMNKDGYAAECYFHNDDASRGFSGGPVIIRRGRHYYVISVMSRKDEFRNVSSSWSVPVSEIWLSK